MAGDAARGALRFCAIGANVVMLLSFWQESALATAAPAVPCRATHRQPGV